MQIKCDIVIPVWNLPDLTKACIESVFSQTKASFHLVIIDNGSDWPTQRYLANLAENRADSVSLIRNEKNLGFVQAVNQGLKVSTASYICLLNNDTRVTAGWLSEMLKVAQDNKHIGIVNANSNTLGCRLKKGQPLEKMAQELKSYSGEYSQLAWATGFCMLIKRELIEKIGLFDEIYGKGNFEDADFSKKAQELGYLVVCAKAAYVYHHERQSFMQLKEFDQQFQQNRQIFYAKWGKHSRLLYVLIEDNLAHIEKIATQTLNLARQGHIVHIFIKKRHRAKLKKHSNVYAYTLPENWFKLISLWRILKRKKKFERIFVDNEDYGHSLNKFKLFHGAEVLYVQ